MKLSRREIIGGVAMGGAAMGAIAATGCAPVENVVDPTAGGATGALTPETVAEAERILGLSFDPAERSLMLESLQSALEGLTKLRSSDMPFDLAPAHTFSPRLPRRPIRSQKNVVSLREQPDAPAPDDDDAIAFASVRELGGWLKSGQISSTRLTEIYLTRIERFAQRLECFATVTSDMARRQAADADREIAAGKYRGLLHGIPYGLKDLADVKGVATTWGAEPYRDRLGAGDATVVRRLRTAGAVLLGKTTCGAIAYGDRWFGGRTRNPWNPAEGSSGSSAGSAAATAAGLCAFSIGTETLGSIVSPSERCGTVGLRPTFGRVSRNGFMPLCWSLDKVGPICRSVEDAAIVLAAINGFDADDPSSVRMGFSYDGRVELTSLAVGYVPAWFEAGDEADRTALSALRDLGVSLREFTWPQADYSTLSAIVSIEAAAAFSELTMSNRDDELSWQAAQAWPNLWRTARFYPAADFVQIDRLRRRLMVEMAEAFEGFDALIGPHRAGGALLATNCTGHPQLVLRSGFAQTPTRGRAGGSEAPPGETFETPRGVSLWGNLFEEGKILALGAALEARLGVAGKRPPRF